MKPIERAKADDAKMGAEILRLQSQLAALQARRAKVRAYIEMVEVYESDDASTDAMRQRGGISGAAVRAAVDAIRERGSSIHTRELIDLLGTQGIQIGGSNPVANLSGFLSRSEELKNSRANGWGLAEWAGENSEQNSSKVAQIRQDSPATSPAAPDPPSADPSWDTLSWETPPWDAPRSASDLDDEIPF